MPPDIRVFKVLSHHGVPFVIVGGHAVNFHGYVRATEDADAVWMRSGRAEEALFAALVELDAKYIGRDIDPATGIERAYPVTPGYLAANHLMMLWTRYGFLDLFDYVPGEPLVGPEAMYESATEVERLRFVSLAWLRRMKRSAGRPKDELDLAELEKVHGPELAPPG